MNLNTEIDTIKNNEYLSIENLKILIKNLKGYFTEKYGEKIDYDKLDLNKLFFENMINIIKPFNESNSKIDIKQLNITTLKHVRDIIEKTYKNTFLEKKSIIDRENDIYNRKNSDNKLAEYSISSSNNSNYKGDIKNDYNNIISSRSENNKINSINFSSKEDENIIVSQEDLLKKLQLLEKERENIPNIDNKNIPNIDNKNIQTIDNKNIQTIDNKNIQTIDNKNINNLLNLEAYSENDNYESNNIISEDISNNIISDDNKTINFVKPSEYLNQKELIDDRKDEINNYNSTNNNTNFENKLTEIDRVSSYGKYNDIKRQKIIINSNKRNKKIYPTSYKYRINLKIPVKNVKKIILSNILMVIPTLKNSINYFILKINDFNIISSNDININNSFCLLYDNKNYNDEIIFNPLLPELNYLDIEILNKNGKQIEKSLENNKKNNILEFILEFI